MAAWPAEANAEDDVDVVGVVHSYASEFLSARDEWPETHKVRTTDPFWQHYDHKQQEILLNIESSLTSLSSGLQGRNVT